MAFNIRYKNSVHRDLKKIDKSICRKLIDTIEEELSRNPTAGKRLTGNFQGLYSYRTGDYRVIYTVIPNHALLILRIAHRKDAYKK